MSDHLLINQLQAPKYVYFLYLYLGAWNFKKPKKTGVLPQV
jgi:hypothetical protein